MGRNVDKRTLFLRALIVVAVVLSLALCVCTFVAKHDVAQARDTRKEARGLDIVSYDAPIWASERISDCWFVQDRQHHCNYWLMKIDGQWLGLSAGEIGEPE